MTRFTLVTSVIFAAGLVACGNGHNQAAQNTNAAGNPSDGNLAPVNQAATQPAETPPVPASGQSYAAPPPGETYTAPEYAEIRPTSHLSKRPSLRRHFLNMRSLRRPVTIMFGRPATGITRVPATIGCPAPGF